MIGSPFSLRSHNQGASLCFMLVLVYFLRNLVFWAEFKRFGDVLVAFLVNGIGQATIFLQFDVKKVKEEVE